MTAPITFGKTAADGGERVVITDGQGHDIDFWSSDDTPVISPYTDASMNARLQYISVQLDRLMEVVKETTKINRVIAQILLDSFEMSDTLEAYELASY